MLILLSKFSQFLDLYKFRYEKNQMLDKPKMCAGNIGTTITIDGLFQEDPVRLDSVKNCNEEYKKVLDFIAKCALHYYGQISFSLRKSNIPVADIKTLTFDLNKETNLLTKKKQLVKSLFGIENTNNIYELETSCEQLEFNCKALLSHPTYTKKQTKSIIFINDRLVECKTLKEAIENTYKYFSTKPIKPFFYIDLKLSSKTIDVNCHPNKKDVIFLNQTEIIGKIVDAFSSSLSEMSSHNHINESFSSIECETSRPSKWLPKYKTSLLSKSSKENIQQISVIPFTKMNEKVSNHSLTSGVCNSNEDTLQNMNTNDQNTNKLLMVNRHRCTHYIQHTNNLSELSPDESRRSSEKNMNSFDKNKFSQHKNMNSTENNTNSIEKKERLENTNLPDKNESVEMINKSLLEKCQTHFTGKSKLVES